MRVWRRVWGFREGGVLGAREGVWKQRCAGTNASPNQRRAQALSLPKNKKKRAADAPAETVATLDRSLSLLTCIDSFFSSLTSAATVFSMPRVSCTGLVPAATILSPSAMKAADRMVAVVVPSPGEEEGWRRRGGG